MLTYSIYNNIIYIYIVNSNSNFNKQRLSIKSSQCYPIWWSWYIEKLPSTRNGIFLQIFIRHPIVKSIGRQYLLCFTYERIFKKKITKSNILREQIFTFVSFPRVNRAPGVVMQRQTIVLRHFHEPFCGIN